MGKKIVLGGREFTAKEISKGKDTFELMEAKLQMKLLDAYRLTEEYRTAYGDYMLEIAPQGAGVTAAVDAIKKFKKLEKVDLVKHKELIVDLLYSRYVLESGRTIHISSRRINILHKILSRFFVFRNNTIGMM